MVSRGEHAPSQRQLRVAEQMRHLLAEQLLRGELHDPRLAGRSLTVAEVRVSRDLKSATVYTTELGGELTREAAAALQQASAYLGGWLARQMHLKYAPRLQFVPTRRSPMRPASSACCTRRSARGLARRGRVRWRGVRRPVARSTAGW